MKRFGRKPRKVRKRRLRKRVIAKTEFRRAVDAFRPLARAGKEIGDGATR